MSLALTLLFVRPNTLLLSITREKTELRVDLKNVGKLPVSVWQPGNSFHDRSYLIEVFVNKRWVTMERPPTNYKQNAPVTMQLGADQSTTFVVSLKDLVIPIQATQIRMQYRPVAFPKASPSDPKLFIERAISKPVALN